MAKITENTNENTTPETLTAITFADIMAGKPQPSLKSIADIFDVPPQRIYSVAKQPVAGEVYDARVYNWGAISRFIEKRIGKEGDKFMTLEEVYEAAIARDDELAASDKRRGSRGGSTKTMIDCGEGKQIPARRKEIALGDTVFLKKYADTFTVVFLTETHVVLQVEGKPALTCLSNWTFNQQYATEPAKAEAPAAESASDAE